MKELKRVYITQGDDEQYYVIPYELNEDFRKELDLNYLLESEFERKFAKYRIGAGINLIELYAKI